MPILVTTDLDIIEEVFIKRFSNFTARRVSFKFLIYTNKR